MNHRTVKTYNTNVTEVWDGNNLIAAFKFDNRSNGLTYQGWINKRDRLMQKLYRVESHEVMETLKQHDMVTIEG